MLSNFSLEFTSFNMKNSKQHFWFNFFLLHSFIYEINIVELAIHMFIWIFTHTKYSHTKVLYRFCIEQKKNVDKRKLSKIIWLCNESIIIVIFGLNWESIDFNFIVQLFFVIAFKLQMETEIILSFSPLKSNDRETSWITKWMNEKTIYFLAFSVKLM